ncbi:MAG: hypothetical protein ACT6SF_09225 [Hydrogenophaga sp.]|jgi:hypothetical protein|uniref:hypothetical protein n=1 Tax=Hydrogenophaga sp. TaxID=1904254 RepID=UPI001D3CBFA1|nr:hypothetical protein [Hydrogenophaga sp.]MBW0172255.1 hypothetical protein [Hydrogenophaga sp.]MBW0185750.1 hypothetical protein [Hydrogenophaga sp.]
MWKSSASGSVHPQATHKLPSLSVDNLCKNLNVAALQQGNPGGFGVCIPGFLPTMKPQLSQLPLIVGYGRVSS